MNAQTILVLVVASAIFGLFAWGMFVTRKSLLLAGIAAIVAVFAAASGWYAWAETHSIPWTIAYGVVTVLGIASAIRHLIGRAR